MKTTHSIWSLLDGDGPLQGVKTDFGHMCILFEVSQDTDDGTYPRLCDWMRDANSLERDGPSHWLNRLARKANKLKIPFYGGVTILRDKKWDTDATLEFDEPVEVVIGKVGDRPIIEKVKKITGEFHNDWFWTKSGRQEKIANGYEIWFEIKDYVE